MTWTSRIKENLEKSFGMPPGTLDPVRDDAGMSALQKIHDELNSIYKEFLATNKLTTSGMGIALGGVVTGLFNHLAATSPSNIIMAASALTIGMGGVVDLFGGMLRDGYRQDIDRLLSATNDILDGKMPLRFRPGVFENGDGELQRWDPALRRVIPVSELDFQDNGEQRAASSVLPSAETTVINRDMNGPSGP